MLKTNKISGDTETFIKSWKKQPEIHKIHWTKGQPKNQTQFAFHNHWLVFNELMENKKFNQGKRTLEVGCGRGSLSAYFADHKYDCSLLDISDEVISSAKKIFNKNNLNANFHVGNANSLPFKEKSFDLTFSVGLLEHFENPATAIAEQVRILDNGGLFIGYVVPHYENNVQAEYDWINEILKGYAPSLPAIKSKNKLFRSDFDSFFYKKILKDLQLTDIQSSGIYSLPMISHSIDFPFSLMPETSEKKLLLYFKTLMKKRELENSGHPWLCKEGYGNAFIVWGYKK
jgi:ubiquinone/menaquinone biosynthesis C-methylase UbiE